MGTKLRLWLHFESQEEVAGEMERLLCYLLHLGLSYQEMSRLSTRCQRHIVKLVNGKETDNVILYVKYHLCIEF